MSAMEPLSASPQLAEERKEKSSTLFANVAKINLILSTSLSMFLTRTILYPTTFTFLFGMSASELVHFLAFFQGANLFALSTFFPAIFDSLWAKVALVLNFYCLTRQVQAFKDLISCQDDFSRALGKSKIGARSGRSKLLFYASLLPLWSIARRGKRLKRVSQPYAHIEMSDPKLVEGWNTTTRQLRRVQLYVGRDAPKFWNSLDIITTDPPPMPGAPVLMYIHGGGWTTGSKFFAANAALGRVASRGVVVVSINYRLAPERSFPTQVLDCKRALVYVKRHCAEWHGDPRKVFVCGESAGGHLCALLGATGNLPLFQPPETLYEDTSVAGAIPLYGIMDWTDSGSHQVTLNPPIIDGLPGGLMPLLERVVMQKSFKNNFHEYELASPFYHVKQAVASEDDPAIPPFMVVHGTRDALAAFNDSKQFFDELAKLRAKFRQEPDVFVPVSGGHHGFGYIVSPFSMALGDAIVDFLFHHSCKLDVVD